MTVYAQPRLKISTSPPSSVPHWIEIPTRYLREDDGGRWLSSSRGRQQELGRFEAGEANFMLDNRMAQFDPENGPDNLCFNGSFESIDSQGRPSGWSFVNPADDGVATALGLYATNGRWDGDASHGLNSLCLVDNSGAPGQKIRFPGIKYGTIPCRVSEVFSFSCYARADAAQVLTLRILNSAGAVLTSSVFTLTVGFQQHKIENVVIPAGTTGMYIELRAGTEAGNASTENVYVDEFTIVRGATAWDGPWPTYYDLFRENTRINVSADINLLSSNDASFEVDVTGVVDEVNCTTQQSLAVAAYDGTYTCEMTTLAAGAYSVRVGEKRDAEAGQRFSGIGYMRTTGPARSGRALLRWYNDIDVLISTEVGDTVALSTSWTETFVTGEAPASAASFALVFEVTNAAAAGEKTHLDAAGMFIGEMFPNEDGWVPGGSIPVFDGYVESITPGYKVRDSLAYVRAVDAFKIYAKTPLPFSGFEALIRQSRGRAYFPCQEEAASTVAIDVIGRRGGSYSTGKKPHTTAELELIKGQGARAFGGMITIPGTEGFMPPGVGAGWAVGCSFQWNGVSQHDAFGVGDWRLFYHRDETLLKIIKPDGQFVKVGIVDSNGPDFDGVSMYIQTSITGQGTTARYIYVAHKPLRDSLGNKYLYEYYWGMYPFIPLLCILEYNPNLAGGAYDVSLTTGQDGPIGIGNNGAFGKQSRSVLTGAATAVDWGDATVYFGDDVPNNISGVYVTPEYYKSSLWVLDQPITGLPGAVDVGYTAPFFLAAVKPWKDDTASVRMNRLLDYIGSPVERKIEVTEDLLVDADDLSDYGSVLEYMQVLADTESASFYFDASGALVFTSRKNRQTADRTSVLTLTNMPTNAHRNVTVTDLVPLFTNREIVNEAQVSKKNSTTYVAEDTLNKIVNETVSESFDDLLYQDDLLSIDYARQIVGRNSGRRKKNFESASAAMNGRAEWGYWLLTTALEDIVTVSQAVPGLPTSVVVDEAVQQIEIVMNKRMLGVRYTLTTVDGLKYFTIGSTTQGRLNTPAVLGA